MTLELTSYQADRVAAALKRRINEDLEWIDWLHQCDSTKTPEAENIKSTLKSMEACKDVLNMIESGSDG